MSNRRVAVRYDGNSFLVISPNRAVKGCQDGVTAGRGTTRNAMCDRVTCVTVTLPLYTPYPFTTLVLLRLHRLHGYTPYTPLYISTSISPLIVDMIGMLRYIEVYRGCNPDVTATAICNRYSEFSAVSCSLLFAFCYISCSFTQQNVRVVFEWQNTIFGDLSNYLVQKASIIHHSVVFAHHRITCQGYTSMRLHPGYTSGYT